jgi:hypothetical protein
MSYFPEILRRTTGMPEIDFLQAVQVASHMHKPDYAEQAKMMALGLEMSGVHKLLGHSFFGVTTSFIPNAPEVLTIQDGLVKQYPHKVKFLGKMTSIGEYWSPLTKSHIILTEFDDLELVESVTAPPDIEEMVEQGLFFETVKRGSIDVPCLALKQCLYVEWQDGYFG